MKSIQSQCSKR